MKQRERNTVSTQERAPSAGMMLQYSTLANLLFLIESESDVTQTCSQVSEVQVQVKSQVFEVKSKSSLKSLKRSPSQVLSL